MTRLLLVLLAATGAALHDASQDDGTKEAEFDPNHNHQGFFISLVRRIGIRGSVIIGHNDAGSEPTGSTNHTKDEVENATQAAEVASVALDDADDDTEGDGDTTENFDEKTVGGGDVRGGEGIAKECDIARTSTEGAERFVGDVFGIYGALRVDGDAGELGGGPYGDGNGQ